MDGLTDDGWTNGLTDGVGNNNIPLGQVWPRAKNSVPGNMRTWQVLHI